MGYKPQILRREVSTKRKVVGHANRFSRGPNFRKVHSSKNLQVDGQKTGLLCLTKKLLIHRIQLDLLQFLFEFENLLQLGGEPKIDPGLLR